MSYCICPSAVTLAGYVLGQTERVEVGTAVSVLSAWHPVALAEQSSLLDQVSGGRFRLGVGRGDPAAVQENIARLGAKVLPLLPGRDRIPPTAGTGMGAGRAGG